MKFTEKQFKKLVEIQELRFPNNLLRSSSNSNTMSTEIGIVGLDLHGFINENDLENEAVALMNLVTREWAHEQFVEKEKRHVWQLKKRTERGYAYRLFKAYSDEISLFTTNGEKEIADDEKLTESEILEWGYNPEMFNKEEVE